MKKEHTVNLQCSFCGKHQREVKKLIAGPTVYICDECIALCNDIIASELEGPELAEGRALLRFRIQRLRREISWLNECLDRFGKDFPGPVRRAIVGVLAVPEDLASAERAWDLAPGHQIPSWLGPPLARLNQAREVLDRFRGTVERFVPPERMVALHGVIGQLSTVRDELVAGVPGETAGPGAAP